MKLQSPNAPDTSRPEVELSGLGVSPVKFTGSVRERPVDVMIDSGSAGDFISLKAAERLGMEKVPFASDSSVQLADGSKLEVNWKTPLFNLRIGSHRELLQLHGLPLKGHEIILGRPWLHKRNPAIDWRTGTITFPRRGEDHNSRSKGSTRSRRRTFHIGTSDEARDVEGGEHDGSGHSYSMARRGGANGRT